MRSKKIKERFRSMIKDEKNHRKYKRKIYKRFKEGYKGLKEAKCMWCNQEKKHIFYIRNYIYCIDCADQAIKDIEKSQSISSSTSGKSSKSSMKSGKSRGRSKS